MVSGESAGECLQTGFKRHSSPPQRAPLDTVYPLRDHLNSVQRMVSGRYCEGLFPDTVCWTRLRNTWNQSKQTHEILRNVSLPRRSGVRRMVVSKRVWHMFCCTETSLKNLSCNATLAEKKKIFDIPEPPKPERGYIGRNHPLAKPPLCCLSKFRGMGWQQCFVACFGGRFGPEKKNQPPSPKKKSSIRRRHPPGLSPPWKPPPLLGLSTKRPILPPPSSCFGLPLPPPRPGKKLRNVHQVVLRGKSRGMQESLASDWTDGSRFT